jgi:antitoxin component of MazEF toxin-antitoxin module
MNSTIVQIGNSRGIRLSKVLLEQAQLKDEVEARSRTPRWLGGCSSTNG